MKKLIAPLIHALFLLPILAITMWTIELTAKKFGLIPDYIQVFKIPYLFIIVGIMVILATPWFWLANRLMRSIEKLISPTFFDHLRLSIFYYFVICGVLLAWIIIGYSGNEDDVYFITFLGISIIAILSNYAFLFRERAY